jgi:hypothetical protein
MGAGWCTWFQPICGTLNANHLPAHAFELEAHDLAGQQAQAGVSPSSLQSNSICSPTHTPNSGLLRDASSTASCTPIRAGCACSRAWRPGRAGPRGRRRDIGDLAGDAHVGFRRDMAQRLRHRAQVAHAVIDYNNFIHGD